MIEAETFSKGKAWGDVRAVRGRAAGGGLISQGGRGQEGGADGRAEEGPLFTDSEGRLPFRGEDRMVAGSGLGPRDGPRAPLARLSATGSLFRGFSAHLPRTASGQTTFWQFWSHSAPGGGSCTPWKGAKVQRVQSLTLRQLCSYFRIAPNRRASAVL